MKAEEVPLWFSIVCACVLNFPQLRHTYLTRDVHALSSTTIVLRILSSMSWLVYASLVQNLLIGISSLVVFISETGLLVMKISWHGVTIAEPDAELGR